MTALHYAAESAHVKVVDYLVKQCTSIDMKAHDMIVLIIRKLADSPCRNGMDIQNRAKNVVMQLEQIHDSFRVHGHIINWSYTGV